MRRGPLTDRTLGNWVLGEILDEGGIGSVYVSRHRYLGEPAAVKVLHKQPLQTRAEEIARRFFQEARATRSIDHPNVVKILDFGQADDGTLYLVMELLEGRCIADILERSKIEERSAAFVAAAVASGLHAAHQKGIVHRDLKPANIFLCASGQVRLLDFGLAKVKEAKLRTAVGTIVGTPQYMAPEQIRQEAIGPKADIYGLGAVLFRMLTGRLPFESESLFDIVKMHLNDPAPRPSRFARVSEQMDAIVLACMEKDPARRPGSMAELRELLRPIAEKAGAGAAARLDGGERDRAELLPRSDTARGLQELARAAAVPEPSEPARGGGWKTTAGLMLVGVMVAAVVVAAWLWLQPSWATRSASARPPPPQVGAPVPAPAPAPVPAPAGAAAPVGAPAPAAANAAGNATITVESDPPGADVFADHVPRGATPLELAVPLPVELKLTLPGYKTVRRKVTHAGPVRVKLAPEPERTSMPHLPEEPEPGEPFN